MDYGKKSNGLRTLMEHWGCLITALIAIVFGKVLMFLFNLTGTPWICLFWARIVTLCAGAVLILYAKLPVYRSGHFFTFGIKFIPGALAGYYRWGWRLFSFGVALSLCLLLSRQ